MPDCGCFHGFKLTVISPSHCQLTVRMEGNVSLKNVLVGSGLIGQGSGPFLTGIMSDALQPSYGADSLRYALAAIVCCHIWGALHSAIAARTYREDLLAKTRS